MSYNDLSEFISLIQFEMQKAFDFSFALARSTGADPNNPTLHLSLERMELEVPVEFTLIQRTTNVETKDTAQKTQESELKTGTNKEAEKKTHEVIAKPIVDLRTILNRPFNLKTLSESPLTMPTKDVKSNVIQIRVIGLDDAHGKPDAQPGIGRLKITITPNVR